MATASTEPLPPSSSPSSSDRVVVCLAESLGDGLIIVAAASETITLDTNNGNDGDDGVWGGGGVSIAAALETTTAAVAASQRVIISSDAKASLQAYFDEKEWPLNRALSRGADFFSGRLGEIVSCYQLTKIQVAQQLLNYKKGKYLNTQVSILLNPSDLDEERLSDSMVVSMTAPLALPRRSEDGG
jgi:hypothetical protein